MKILIIEDNHDIATQISDYAKEQGFVPHIADNGEDGQFEGEEGGYAAIILDLGLPEIDGITILEHWRKQGITTPVIILTARHNKMDVVRGLDAGADDYMTKPFDLDELIARLRSNIRRHGSHLQNTLSYKDIELNIRSRRVLKAGHFVKLTKIEFLIMQLLFTRQGTPLSINDITEHVYEDFDHDSAIIPRHIANIRKKLGHDIIVTEANRGYYVPQDDATLADR